MYIVETGGQEELCMVGVKVVLVSFVLRSTARSTHSWLTITSNAQADHRVCEATGHMKL